MCRSKSRFLSLAATLVVASLTACGGGGSASEQPVAESADNDLDIATRVYSAEQRTPTGFLEDPTSYPGLSEFRFHVSNVDLAPTGTGVRFEVCATDFLTALDWSAVASQARGLVSTSTSTSETEWYFQVDRALDSDPSSMVVSRIFKCAALDRSARDETGAAGAINRAPVGAADLRFVSEYLWQFSLYNNALHAIVTSAPASEPGLLHHDLIRAEAVVGAGLDGCDRIDLYRWRHTVDTATGELSESETFIRSFSARFENAAVAVCTD